jgi:hypothetical protein
VDGWTASAVISTVTGMATGTVTGIAATVGEECGRGYAML